jgi:hypothetical protein
LAQKILNKIISRLSQTTHQKDYSSGAGTVAHACNLNSPETETGRIMFETSLGKKLAEPHLNQTVLAWW